MASEYEIRNEDGQLFCKCQTGDGDVRLVTEKIAAYLCGNLFLRCMIL